MRGPGRGGCCASTCRGTPRCRRCGSVGRMKVTGLTPILYATDFQRLMDYFVEKLGFRKLWDWGAPPTFGAVTRDHAEIFLCQGGQGQAGTWLSVFVDDVDELHEE